MRGFILFSLLAVASPALASAESDAAAAFAFRKAPAAKVLTGCQDNPACSLECQCGCNYGAACKCPMVEVKPQLLPRALRIRELPGRGSRSGGC